MPRRATNTVAHASTAKRASELFSENKQSIYQHTDRLFVYLMVLQWLAGIVFALLISPRAWYGISSSIHPHVWAAAFLGGVISFSPLSWP